MDSLGDLNTKFSTTERCKKVVGLVRFQVSLRLVQHVVSPHRKFWPLPDSLQVSGHGVTLGEKPAFGLKL
jgi:hypothetical protein